MSKYLFRKVIIVRILVIVLFCFLTVQLIQSYSLKIFTFQSNEQTQHEIHYSSEQIDILPVSKIVDQNLDEGVTLVDLQKLPKCPKTFFELFGNRKS